MRRAAAICICVLASVTGVARGQCGQWQLLSAGALKPGQSLAVRPFDISRPPHYKAEPAEEFKKVFAADLRAAVEKLHRFSSVIVVSDTETPTTDLVMEGSFTEIDQGNRALRILWATEKSAARLGVSSVIKRVSTGENVAWFRCASKTWGGLLGAGGLFSRGGKTLIHSRSRAIARDITESILKSDKKPAAAKPPKVW
jgi:hypothetical protein